MESSPKYPLKIVVLGESGQGKSTICNTLLSSDTAKTGDSECAKGVTKNIKDYQGKLFSDEIEFIIYDTPGFDDRDVDYYDYIETFEKEFNGTTIDFIFYVIKRTDYRFNRNHKLFMQIIEQLFDKKESLSASIILLITHCDFKLEKNENSFAEDILKEINNEMNWKMSKYLCFSKYDCEQFITNLSDLIHSHDRNFLKFKSKIDLPSISRVIESSIPKNMTTLFGQPLNAKKITIYSESDVIELKVCFVGNAHVGKTSIFNKLLNGNSNIQNVCSTIGRILFIKL